METPGAFLLRVFSLSALGYELAVSPNQKRLIHVHIGIDLDDYLGEAVCEVAILPPSNRPFSRRQTAGSRERRAEESVPKATVPADTWTLESSTQSSCSARRLGTSDAGESLQGDVRSAFRDVQALFVYVHSRRPPYLFRMESTMRTVKRYFVLAYSIAFSTPSVTKRRAAADAFFKVFLSTASSAGLNFPIT